MSLPMAGTPETPEMRQQDADAALRYKRRRARSIAIALVLGVLVILFYLVTIAKLGPGVMERPL
ncbi:MAG: hypothetical protein J0H08_00670 [Rhizobiales bacterium]|jgi:hypothetical protein|nr:hypothetical protein [Hyphomicrobiales bacterium]